MFSRDNWTVGILTRELIPHRKEREMDIAYKKNPIRLIKLDKSPSKGLGLSLEAWHTKYIMVRRLLGSTNAKIDFCTQTEKRRK